MECRGDWRVFYYKGFDIQVVQELYSGLYRVGRIDNLL